MTFIVSPPPPGAQEDCVDDPVWFRSGHSGDRPEGAAGARGQSLHCRVNPHS